MVHSAACMDLRRINGDYKSATILAELEYKEFYCLNKFLTANPKVKAAWTEEMVLPESRRDDDWWKTFVLFALLVVGVWFKMRQQKRD